MKDTLHVGPKRSIHMSLLVTILISCMVTTACHSHSDQDIVHNTAARLGYDPNLKIAIVGRCWDIFTHCGQFLYFRTDQTSKDLERRIDALQWTLLNKVEVDGYEIFTNINLGTRSRLEIDGSDGIEDRSELPRLRGVRWRLSDPQGRRWIVTHFPLTDIPNSIELDGVSLQQSIVSVLYQTR